MEQPGAGGMIPLYVPAERYEAMVAHLAAEVAGGASSSPSRAVVYQKYGVPWTQSEIREFAEAAKKWDFAVDYLRYIAENAPSGVSIELLGKALAFKPIALGGKLSGLGKWLKAHAKVRPENADWTVWPMDKTYGTNGETTYRMNEAVARIILDTLQ